MKNTQRYPMATPDGHTRWPHPMATTVFQNTKFHEAEFRLQTEKGQLRSL